MSRQKLMFFYGFREKEAILIWVGHHSSFKIRKAKRFLSIPEVQNGPMLLEALEEDFDNMISTVFLTHLHFDHIANINLFPHATFILSRKEWEYANTRDDLFVMEGSLPLLRSFKKRLVEIDGEELLPGITCLHTPGHTPGCLSLVVDMKEKGRWVIAGDAIKTGRS